MFEVVVAADAYMLDMYFIRRKLNFLLQNKKEFKIFTNIRNLTGEIDDESDVAENYVFFWSGEDVSLKKRIKSCIDKGHNVKVINYGSLRLTVWATVKKNFPRNKYINYEGKPFSCLRHLNNWIDKTEGMGGKVTYINFEIND